MVHGAARRPLTGLTEMERPGHQPGVFTGPACAIVRQRCADAPSIPEEEAAVGCLTSEVEHMRNVKRVLAPAMAIGVVLTRVGWGDRPVAVCPERR